MCWASAFAKASLTEWPRKWRARSRHFGSKDIMTAARLKRSEGAREKPSEARHVPSHVAIELTAEDTSTAFEEHLPVAPSSHRRCGYRAARWSRPGGRYFGSRHV